MLTKSFLLDLLTDCLPYVGRNMSEEEVEEQFGLHNTVVFDTMLMSTAEDIIDALCYEGVAKRVDKNNSRFWIINWDKYSQLLNAIDTE
jgi:hypothetical protein